MAQKTDDLAADIYDKIARASGENGRLRRAIKAVLAHAETGLAAASDNGCAAWREALQEIVRITKNL